MEALKAPIQGDAAFGSYLKSDRAAYRALRNVFNGGQTAFRALSETAESLLDRNLQLANQAAWARMAEESEKVLLEKSKDIEIFVWFTAAQMHQPKAIENTAAALCVLTDLVESNWDDLHPIPPVENADAVNPNKENDAAKLRIFLQLVGEVPRGGLLHLPLINLPLFQDVNQSQLIVAEKDGALDRIRPVLAETIASDRNSVTALIAQLQAFLSHTVRLDGALRLIAARCGETPVPVTHLTRQLEDILRLLKALSEGTGFVWPKPAGEAEAEAETPPENGGADPSAQSVADQAGATAPFAGFALTLATSANREAALEALAELARYFRTTEPQSPVHLMLDRALRWGRMSIVELYAELLGEGSESYNRLSLVSGMESFEHSGRAGRPAPSQRAALPELASYASALPNPRMSGASTPHRRNMDTVERQDTPEVEASPASTQPDDAQQTPDSQQNTEAPADLPVRSFEW